MTRNPYESPAALDESSEAFKSLKSELRGASEHGFDSVPVIVGAAAFMEHLFFSKPISCMVMVAPFTKELLLCVLLQCCTAILIHLALRLLFYLMKVRYTSTRLSFCLTLIGFGSLFMIVGLGARFGSSLPTLAFESVLLDTTLKNIGSAAFIAGLVYAIWSVFFFRSVPNSLSSKLA